MKILVLDHIVKSLQSRGGISRVWFQISNRIHCDKKIDINDRQVSKVSLKIFLIRYLPSFFYRLKSNHVFLSSYYRVSIHPRAYNIVIVHDLIYELFPNKSLGSILHLMQRRFSFWWADKIICISNNTKSDLLSRYEFIKKDKVVVIHNGVDDVFIDDTPPAYLQVPFDSFFLYVGSRGECKNFLHVIKVLRKFENFHCIAVTSDFTKDELEKYSDVLNRIFIINNISDSELKYLYFNCEFLLFPSLYEGFGLPIVESFACGTNVVLPRAHCFPEVSGDLAIFYDFHDLNSLFDAVCYAVNHKLDDNNHLIDFAKNYCWDNIIKQYQRVLDYEQN